MEETQVEDTQASTLNHVAEEDEGLEETQVVESQAEESVRSLWCLSACR